MRRDSSHLFPLILILLLFSALSYGQAWSGIISSSRAINWTGAGLPPTLPDGETTPNPWTPPTRTQCTSYSGYPSAITGTGTAATDVAAINNALAACTTGTYIPITGTFNISGVGNCYGGGAITCISMYAQNGVTLRGSGPQSTKLSLSGEAIIAFGEANGNGSGMWSTGFSQGATSLTMSSPSGPTLTAGYLLYLQQCDTGWSGSGCSTGSYSDNGGLYICGLSSVCDNNGGSSLHRFQQQVVYVTSVTGSGPYTVNFTPGLYMPNWSSSNSPTVSWTKGASGAPAYGNGLEDLTIDTTGGETFNGAVYMNETYASWVKGVRVVGYAVVAPFYTLNTKSCLIANNYLDGDTYADTAFNTAFQRTGDSDSLIINNIMRNGTPLEGLGSNEGGVFAYNYGRDNFTNYYFNRTFEHYAGTAFLLHEGNELGQIEDDDTWGTHTLNTLFRNYVSGWDSPYVGSSSNPGGISW